MIESGRPVHINSNMYPSVDNEVLVVGAGIAGATAALELQRRGIPTRIVDRKSAERGGPERSEMTLSGAIRTIGAEAGVTQPLSCVNFMSLDNGKNFFHSLTSSADALDNVAVAIDHTKVIASLWQQVKDAGIPFEQGSSVSAVVELPGLEGVKVIINGEKKNVRTVVNAAGPAWRNLPFFDSETQQDYENSLVAVAYGARCRGQILHDEGYRMMLHPVSLNGSGRTSWVNASGDGEIEVVFSDYSRRKDVGKMDRKNGLKLLMEELQKRKLIEIQEIGPIISGFFGLEARRKATGNMRIFTHGERAQYNAATVGDAIAPTVRLSPILADIIGSGGNAADFEAVAAKTFHHKLELATTRARIKANQLGGIFDMFNVVKWLSEKEQAEFIRTHAIPKRFLPFLFIRYPHLLKPALEIASEYVKI